MTTRRDRKFMELAVREMRKSQSEHTHKADPLVGAVIAGPSGNLLAKTHRGGLREGDHAEFTLIDKILHNKNLKGATLYVTLEPCTKRSLHKSPCAKRIVSARIKKVFIGMPDPNPEIQGRGFSYLQEHDIEVDFFDNYFVRQIRKSNADFIKHYASATATSGKPPEPYEGPSEMEKEPVRYATLKDLSPVLMKAYLKARKVSLKVPSQRLTTFLCQNGFVVSKGKREHTPTVAGLLLFGTHPENFFGQTIVKVEARDGQKMVAEDISGALLTLPDKIKAFLDKNMTQYTEIRSFKRESIPEYPWEALREAVMNALVHRDYKAGARVMIRMTKGSIEVRSPGLPLRPLSLDRIREYNAPAFSRNPRIAETFTYMRFMDERGWGLKQMRDLLVKHGLREPQFDIDAGFFVVKMIGNESVSEVIRISSELLTPLDDRLRELVELIRVNGRYTAVECAKHFKVSRAAASAYFRKLIQLGIIQRKGSGPRTYFVLFGS